MEPYSNNKYTLRHRIVYNPRNGKTLAAQWDVSVFFRRWFHTSLLRVNRRSNSSPSHDYIQSYIRS